MGDGGQTDGFQRPNCTAMSGDNGVSPFPLGIVSFFPPEFGRVEDWGYPFSLSFATVHPNFQGQAARLRVSSQQGRLLELVGHVVTPHWRKGALLSFVISELWTDLGSEVFWSFIINLWQSFPPIRLDTLATKLGSYIKEKSFNFLLRYAKVFLHLVEFLKNVLLRTAESFIKVWAENNYKSTNCFCIKIDI